MSHAVTIGGLLLSIGAMMSIVMVAFGVLAAFANMMADAAGDNGKQGCTIAGVGLVLLVLCILGLLL